MATTPLHEPSHYFITDTSSLIAIREIVPVSSRGGVFLSMSQLVQQGHLLYPNEVAEELAAHVRSPDPIFTWVKSNKETATRFGTRWDELQEVMKHPIASLVIDIEKASGPDEADPYVLALALALRKRAEVLVVTEETRDRLGRNSMTTACGALRLVRLPLRAFLMDRKIWAG